MRHGQHGAVFRSAAARSGQRVAGSRWPTETAKAAAEAECPEGKDVEVGIDTQRDSGTPRWIRSGRTRRRASFMGWFTTSDVTPMDATPTIAANRPREPPNTARAAAVANHGLEWLAASDIVRSGRSSTGVEKPATAR